MKPQFTKDDGRALIATLVFATLLLSFSLWYTIEIGKNLRPSFIEVEFGEFITGSITEFSELENDEVANRPNPAETETEQPTEEAPEVEEIPETSTLNNTKPVDLPDKVEEIFDEAIETPVAEEIDPTQSAEKNMVEQVEIAPLAKENIEIQEGAIEGGDVDGATGDTDSDQGIGNDEDNTSPYDLTFEGDLDRTPLSQTLPVNNTNLNATVTMGFEVLPDGSVGRIWPIRRSGNPELERTVLATLRNWRFTKLPKRVPQTNQRGSITFKFIVE